MYGQVNGAASMVFVRRDSSVDGDDDGVLVCREKMHKHKQQERGGESKVRAEQ